MTPEVDDRAERDAISAQLATDPEAELTASIAPNELDTDIGASDTVDWQQEIDPDSDLGQSLAGQNSADLTEGDLDIDSYLAEVDGDEAVGGTTAMPEQNDVDGLGDAAGVDLPDGGMLHTTQMLERRDLDRWELDPDSVADV
jgi:Family of unknown function (DUF6335)